MEVKLGSHASFHLNIKEKNIQIALGKKERINLGVLQKWIPMANMWMEAVIGVTVTHIVQQQQIQDEFGVSRILVYIWSEYF